jgi:pyruvyl transferase EpsO
MSESAAESPADLVSRLRRRIGDALGPLLALDEPIALLDFPSFPNVGDSCLWLGTIQYLRSLGVRLRYTADSRTYAREHLASLIGGGTILISGGGNLGDLWPVHQPFREAVIAAFPRNRIIQLPQSISFRDPAALARAREVFDRHPDLVLLVRDESSLALARNEFRSPSILCPDMSLALGVLERPAPAVRPIVWLARSDAESAHAPPSTGLGDAVEVVDWRRDRPSLPVALNRIARALPFHRRFMRPLRRPLSRLYEPLARQRLARGCRTLAAGRIVITDRLHGHLLCLLLGIPHLLLDNTYGKNRSFYETWTNRCTIARWCDDPAQALATAREERARGG